LLSGYQLFDCPIKKPLEIGARPQWIEVGILIARWGAWTAGGRIHPGLFGQVPALRQLGTQLPATGLVGGQGGFRPLGNGQGLGLGNRGQDVQRQPIRVRLPD
jgi:hypothetical protein